VRFQAVTDPEDRVTALAGEFQRAGEWHGFAVITDPSRGGRVVDVAVFEEPDEWSVAVDGLKDEAASKGTEAYLRTLDGAEFRRRVERGLDARATFLRETMEPELADEGPAGADTIRAWMAAGDADRDEKIFVAGLCVLLRTRVRSLPAAAADEADRDTATVS
jgi:hypothetical protein